MDREDRGVLDLAGGAVDGSHAPTHALSPLETALQKAVFRIGRRHEDRDVSEYDELAHAMAWLWRGRGRRGLARPPALSGRRLGQRGHRHDSREYGE
jgi:hypothetical protein